MKYSHDNPEFPDTYPNVEFKQANPNAVGDAYVDRDDYLDYPKIIFDHIDDFANAIDFEQETIDKYFPNGVRLHHSVTHQGADSIVVSYYIKGTERWTYERLANEISKQGLSELMQKLAVIDAS